MRSKAILGMKNSQKIRLRAIGIAVSGLKSQSQIPLLIKEKTEEDLAGILDKINEKYGDWTIYSATLALIHKGEISQR